MILEERTSCWMDHKGFMEKTAFFKVLENKYNLEFQADRTKPTEISRPESADHILVAKRNNDKVPNMPACIWSREERKAFVVDRQSKSKNQVLLEKITTECGGERDTEFSVTTLQNGNEESACQVLRNEYLEERKNSEWNNIFYNFIVKGKE